MPAQYYGGSSLPSPPGRARRASSNSGTFLALCFDLPKYTGDEIDEHAHAYLTSMVRPVQQCDVGRVVRLPIEEHRDEAAALHMRPNG